MLKVFFILLFFISSISFSLENKEEFIVKRVVFKGLKRINFDKALNITNIHIGDKIDNKKISDAIHNLFSSNNFEDIQIMKNGSSLIIYVKEYPIISNITFSGNKLIKEELLKQNLNYRGIKIGEFINYTYLFNFKKDLEKFYFNKGNFNIKVKTLVIPLSQNKVDVNVIIHEGSIIKVKQINIIGNQNFSTSKLISNFSLCNKTYWWNFFKNSNYQSEKLNNDLTNLNNFYLNHGYACFDIYSVKINFSNKKNEMYINVNIFEGIQYKVSEIIIYDDNVNKDITIINLINSQIGKLYNFNQITEIKNRIQKLLNTQGYIYPKIMINLKTNETNRTVKVYFDINFGKRFYVRNIIFQGNNITRDYVLRREINQLENTYVNTDLVNQGKTNLDNLGYFEYVNIKNKFVSDEKNNDLMDIIYIVKEKNNNNINLGLGIGTESGINYQLNIQQDNWIGSGNNLNFISNKSDHQTYLEFSLTEPFFTMQGISLGWKIFYNNINYNSIYTSDYYLHNHGIGILTDLPIDKSKHLNINLDYVHNKLTNIMPQLTIWHYLTNNKIKYKKNNKTGNTNFSADDIFMTIGYNFNSINNDYFPSKGLKFNLIGKFTTFKSCNKYYKVFLNSNIYFKINNFPKLILMCHEYLAYSNSLRGIDVPFYDNLYFSNFNMIRGFYSNSIGPKAIYYKCNKESYNYNNCSFYESDINIGGNSMFVNTIELILPIPFLKEENTYPICTSLFIDSGALWNTNRKLNKIINCINSNILKNYNSIRISSGISLQWISPLGPIMFSYSKPIKKCKYDKLEQFQFNIGKTW